MKRPTIISLLLVIIGNGLFAQVPQGINYQTVVRNNVGNVIPNQNVTMRFSVVSGSSTGTISYSEVHSATTNSLGLLNLIIGQGTPITGTFSAINWGAASHFLAVDMDPQGGTSFQPMGTSQLMSVPYALNAGNSSASTSLAQLTDVDVSGLVDGQVLKWNVSQSKWLPANDLDADGQTLALNGVNLSISGGNSVVLPSPGGNGWLLTGNTGTNSNSDFLGTIDAQPINIQTNGILRARISTKGQIETFNTGGSIFIGSAAGQNDDLSNNKNVFVGDSAGYTTIAGSANTSIGYASLRYNRNGANNTATGYKALYAHKTASSNTANGYMALAADTSGSSNTAIGSQALTSNTSGSSNTAVGVQALVSNTIGSQNTAVGDGALVVSNIAYQNTAIGSNALNASTTASYNTAIGSGAGYYGGLEIGTGNYNTLLGYHSSTNSNTSTNCIVIAGNGNLSPGGNNRVRIGNSSISSIGGQVGWTTISDERVKLNVRNDISGLSFIMKLNPVTYSYSIAKSNLLQNKVDSIEWAGKHDIENTRFSGFFAQDVDAAATASGYSFSGVDKPEDPKGLWGLRYAEFTVPLVKAVQEQQEQIEALKKEIETLKGIIESKDKISTGTK